MDGSDTGLGTDWNGRSRGVKAGLKLFLKLLDALRYTPPRRVNYDVLATLWVVLPQDDFFSTAQNPSNLRAIHFRAACPPRMMMPIRMRAMPQRRSASTALPIQRKKRPIRLHLAYALCFFRLSRSPPYAEVPGPQKYIIAR